MFRHSRRVRLITGARENNHDEYQPGHGGPERTNWRPPIAARGSTVCLDTGSHRFPVLLVAQKEPIIASDAESPVKISIQSELGKLLRGKSRGDWFWLLTTPDLPGPGLRVKAKIVDVIPRGVDVPLENCRKTGER